MAGLVMHGYTQLKVLAKAAGPEVQKDLDKRLRELAEPVRASAESLAVANIPRIGLSWSRMRVGVTRKATYVAPKQRGQRRRGPLSRPNLADLLEDRSMTPALRQHEAGLEAGAESVLYGFASRWNRI